MMDVSLFRNREYALAKTSVPPHRAGMASDIMSGLREAEREEARLAAAEK